MIQGQNVRLVLRKAGELPDLKRCEAGDGARLVEVAPRLEDAFIDILGGGPGGHSVLAELMHPRDLPAGVDSAAVIKAQDLTRMFGDFTATDHVSFQVGRGEIFGLLGPNGAGKSTTFKMMCGLLAPTSGLAQVMGLDLKHSASQARQNLGYMAQKFSLYGKLSVAQNLRFFSGVYGLRGAVQQSKMADMKVKDLPFPPELFQEQAQRRVSLGLIISALVEANKLDAKPEQVKALVAEFADSYEDPEEVTSWYYASPERLDGPTSMVIEDNVVEFVLGRANVVEKELSFDTLMGSNA